MWLEGRLQRIITYFVEGDLDRKMKRMSLVMWILIAMGIVAMVWAAKLEVNVFKPGSAIAQKVPAWRILLKLQ